MTTVAMEYGGADLPPRIQRAIARALDPRFPIALTSAERVALAALLRRVEARDGRAAFWVRRVNLGDLFDRVERTVSNWLSSLEDKGLIEKEQGRSRWGNYSCLTLHLTDLASSLLGLNQELSPAQPKKTSSGYRSVLPKGEQSLQRHRGADLVEDSKPKTIRGVPLDCAPLLELNFLPSAVFKLMKRATKHGKRLGDVVKARFKAIAGARHPFGLAWLLAGDGIDYGSLGALEAREEQDTSAREAQQRAVKSARRRLGGAWVQTKPDARVKFADDGMPSLYKLEGGQWLFKRHIVGEEAVKLWARAAVEEWQPMVT